MVYPINALALEFVQKPIEGNSGQFDRLPTEINLKILNYLHIAELAEASLINKKFLVLSCEDILWRPYFNSLKLPLIIQGGFKGVTISGLRSEYADIETRLVLNHSTKISSLHLNDFKFACKFIDLNYKFYSHLSREIRLNKNIALRYIMACPKGKIVTTQLDPELAKDKDFMWLAVKWSGGWLYHATKDLQADRELVLSAVSTYGPAIEYVIPSLQTDPDILLSALKSRRSNVVLHICNETTFTLKFRREAGTYFDLTLDNHLMSDQWMKLLILKNPEEIKGAKPELHKDLSFILELVRQHGYILEHLSPEFKNNEEVVWRAANSFEDSFQWADPSLRSNYQYVKELIDVCGCGNILKYASQELQENPELLELAYQNGLDKVLGNCESIKKDIALTLIKTSGLFLQDYSHLDEDFYNTDEYKKALIARDGITLKDAPEHLKKDISCVCDAVEENPESFQYADPSIQNKIEDVLEILTHSGTAIRWMREEIKKNIAAITRAVESDGAALGEIHPSFRNHPQVLDALLEGIDWDLVGFKRALPFLGLQLFENRNFSLKAIKAVHLSDARGVDKSFMIQRIFYSLKESIRNDSKFLLEAICIRGEIFNYANELIRSDEDFAKALFEIIPKENIPEIKCAPYFMQLAKENPKKRKFEEIVHC